MHMENNVDSDKGLRLLIQKCRDEFRRAENTDFYAKGDYQAAERRLVKFCLFTKIGN